MKFKLKKINLFYYDADNFGDALNPVLIEEFSGCKVQYKNIRLSRKERLVAVLTLNYTKIKKYFMAGSESIECYRICPELVAKRIYGMGAGFMNHNEYFKGGDLFAVRGRLTDENLKKQGFQGCHVYGDPALLLPLWLKPSKKKEYTIGIIPHWREADFFIENYGHLYHVIDLRTKNVEYIVEEITKCRHILSSSLHGIIAAHAYSIPALWIKKGYIDTDGFKFKDYFSSVNIPLYDGFEYHDEIFHPEKWKELFNSNKDKMNINCSLKRIQENLLKSAPFELKEKYFKLVMDEEIPDVLGEECRLGA